MRNKITLTLILIIFSVLTFPNNAIADNLIINLIVNTGTSTTATTTVSTSTPPLPIFDRVSAPTAGGSIVTSFVDVPVINIPTKPTKLINSTFNNVNNKNNKKIKDRKEITYNNFTDIKYRKGEVISPQGLLSVWHGKNLYFTWQNPKLEEGETARLVRSPYFYPKNPSEGKLIYEGKGVYTFDREFINSGKYYYSLFIVDKNDFFSSPALTVVNNIKDNDKESLSKNNTKLLTLDYLLKDGRSVDFSYNSQNYNPKMCDVRSKIDDAALSKIISSSEASVSGVADYSMRKNIQLTLDKNNGATVKISILLPVYVFDSSGDQIGGCIVDGFGQETEMLFNHTGVIEKDGVNYEKYGAVLQNDPLNSYKRIIISALKGQSISIIHSTSTKSFNLSPKPSRNWLQKLLERFHFW